MSTVNQKFFEKNFEDSLVQKGEDLYLSDTVSDIHLIERNFYTVVVNDGKNYEVELLRPFAKASRYTCDCSFYKVNGQCRHIIAALFALRKLQDIKEQEKTKRKTEKEPRREKYATLNINNILSQVEFPDLKNFVKHYATKDKKFSTELKVHFARKVDLADNEKKYKAILDSVIRPMAGKETDAKAADVRNLVKIATELCEQAGDTLSLELHGECFNILKNTINKVNYTRYHYDYYESELLNINKELHILLKELMEASIPQDLRENIQSYIRELAQTSYYQYQDITVNVALMALDMKFIPVEELLEIVQKQKERNFRDDEQLSVLYALMFIAMEELGTESQFTPEKKHLQLMDRIPEQIIKSGKLKSALKLVKKLINLTPSISELRMTEILLLMKLNREQEYRQAINDGFLMTNDLRILDIARESLPESDFEILIENLNEELIKKGTSSDKLAGYYTRTEQWHLLMESMKKLRDFRTLMNYDKVLYSTNLQNELCLLYESMVEEFLETHIGSVSLNFIDELINHFKRIRATKVLNRVVMMIEMKFPHRSRLMEVYK
jgi:hypothetical protein